MSMKTKYVIGLTIQELRKEKGWNMRELAIRVPMSLGHLSEVERGKKELSLTLFDSISNALGMKPYQVMIEAGYKAMAFETPIESPAQIIEYV